MYGLAKNEMKKASDLCWRVTYSMPSLLATRRHWKCPVLAAGLELLYTR